MKPTLLTQPLHPAASDFWDIFTASTCAVERRRAQFFALLAEGRPIREVLSVTRYSRVTAYTLTARYHALGLAGLADARHTTAGAPTVLLPEEQQRLTQQLQTDFEQGVVWDGKKVQTWIRNEFGKDVYIGRTYEFLRAAGFSPQRPRPQHVGSDAVAREDFKTNS